MPLIETLKRLSAAEDFFQLLGVAYDPAVLHVARLHILKRMGEHLGAADLASLTDAEVAEAARDALQTAYTEFTRTRPIDARVFKVLKKAVAPADAGSFVPLSRLTLLATSGR